MNDRSLYETRILVKDRRVYIVEAYGQLEVWSVYLDEPIGCVESRKGFAAAAKAKGWIATTESAVRKAATAHA